MKYNDATIEQVVVDAVKTCYGYCVSSIVFVSVGEESFAYVVTTAEGKKLFIKYRSDPSLMVTIERVNTLLLQLRHLDFVVAPIETKQGTTFCVANGILYGYPYIAGEVVDRGNDTFDKILNDQLTQIMTMIHTATDIVTVPLPQETFCDDFLSRLEAVKKLIKKETTEKDIRNLFATYEAVIQKLMSVHDDIANKYQAVPPAFVLMHGDITGLNIIRSPHGLKLVDWDGAMFAPPERDLQFFIGNRHFSPDTYLQLTGQTGINRELCTYYSQQWALNSIIGNFKSLLTNEKEYIDRKEYMEEIEQYVRYYRLFGS